MRVLEISIDEYGFEDYAACRGEKVILAKNFGDAVRRCNSLNDQCGGFYDECDRGDTFILCPSKIDKIDTACTSRLYTKMINQICKYCNIVSSQTMILFDL